MKASVRNELLIHVFGVSAGMVGVCLAGISLFHIVNSLGRITILGSDFLAADAFLFLLACVASFWALRTSHPNFVIPLERIADGLFLLALTLMVGVCGVLVYAVTAVGG